MKQITSKSAERRTETGAQMRTVTMNTCTDINGTKHTYESVEYLPFVSPQVKAGAFNDQTYARQAQAEGTQAQMQNRRQADADLWDMLSFRGMTFNDAVSDLQNEIVTYRRTGKQISVNALERFGMCIVRATFKDLIAKGADAYQTAVYDEFRHDIRLEMNRRMASDTAYEVNRNRKGDTVRAVADAQAVDVLKNQNERFDSGMDLMHAVLAQVLEAVSWGADFKTVIKVDKRKKSALAWKGEDELTDEMIEKETDLVNLCFRACRDEIERQASIKAVDNGYTYIEAQTRTRAHGWSECIDAVCAEDRDGYTDEKIYLRMKQNVFTGECTSIAQVRALRSMINGMHLTDAQMRRLEMKARGYSIEQIAGEEKTSRRAIQKSIEQVRAKALKWLQAQEITAGAQTASEMFMIIEQIEAKAEAQAEAQAQAEAEAQRQAQRQAQKTCAGNFKAWKNEYLMQAMQAGIKYDAYAGAGIDYFTEAKAEQAQDMGEWSTLTMQSYWKASARQNHRDALNACRPSKPCAKARHRTAVYEMKHGR